MTKNDNRGTTSGGDPTFDGDRHWQQAAQRLYEPDRDGGLTTAIVFAIADAADVLPSELTSPTLYETVDVAGIEQAFFSSHTDVTDRNGAGSVDFRYTEYLVTVGSDGWIRVHERTEPETV